MNRIEKTLLFSALVLMLGELSLSSQVLHNVGLVNKPGLNVESIVLNDSNVVSFPQRRIFFSFYLDQKICYSGDVDAVIIENRYSQDYDNKVNVKTEIKDSYPDGLKGEVVFENIGNDTVSISNFVPFGENARSVYITGKGPWDLARAWLFRPGLNPVRVILPDNAWELGYSSFNVTKELSVCALARRTKIEGGQSKRYETILPPRSKVTYTFYAEVFMGGWQNGLRIMFRDRYLHDLSRFDNQMYERSDLSWIKESYLIILQMAWDREFFDRQTGKYTFPEVIKKGIEQFGFIDVCGIWPTWPHLGLDQRNQWDLYRDLPGGTKQLNTFVKLARQYGTRFFIAYNPWDNSTRKEDHYKGMARLIAETEADGVVLDTRGASSYQLQAAADSVRKGVVMYSEGMAVTKDMPGIISGRVHNAIYLSPELNLNKLIKPDFSIFRVCDVGEGIIHRELAISFFNGYGTELNMFRPGGRDDNYRSDMGFLSKTTFTMRQNNDAFLDKNWIPLVETTKDNVYVNRWKSEDKVIYTVLNMRSEGVYGKLFKTEVRPGKHFVSLWNHENLSPVVEKDATYLPVSAPGWDPSYNDTRQEGSVDCIAEFPSLIKSELSGDSIRISSSGQGRIMIWKGNPSYQTVKQEFRILNDTTIRIRDVFGIYEGKIVVQLIERSRLKDENVLHFRGGKPWLISRVNYTKRTKASEQGMVLVPSALFSYEVTPGDDFIPYPNISKVEVKIDSFLIDKFPVTNAQYYDFLLNTGYRPADTSQYLRHWHEGLYKQGQEKYPVVYVSHEDMNAYAKWAQKRLPTQAEWQYAAQGSDNRKWPWGNEFHGTNCNNSFNRPTPVDAFMKGQSQFGVLDLVGNVWQMTNDMYFNGTNYFAVIRGGSYYKPESSWWYLQGGPQQLDKTQILLLVSPGFDRSPTVGFRCVKDIDFKNFRNSKQ